MKPITLQSLRDYVSKGWQPGGFLTAVLENDFMRAVCNADEENRRDLYEIAIYVYNDMPSVCWGSRAKVTDWLHSFSDQPPAGPSAIASDSTSEGDDHGKG